MGAVKEIRLFIAEDYCAKKNIKDINKGFLAADDLWYRATVGNDMKAQMQIGKYAKMYRGEQA